MNITDNKGNVIAQLSEPVAVGLTFVHPQFVDNNDVLAAALGYALKTAREFAARDGRVLDPDHMIAIEVKIGTVPDGDA